MVEQYEDLLKRAAALDEDMTKLFHLTQERAIRKVSGRALEDIGDVVGNLGWTVKVLKGNND